MSYQLLVPLKALTCGPPCTCVEREGEGEGDGEGGSMVCEGGREESGRERERKKSGREISTIHYPVAPTNSTP